MTRPHLQPVTGAQVLTVKSRDPKQGKTEEIPTPEVWAVPSYESDYRPAFRSPASYIRGAPPSPFAARGELGRADF